jgi:hypothetical protein
MLSLSEERQLISEHGRARAEGKILFAKAAFFGSAFIGGGFVGYLNSQEGGSAGTPYLVGGKVPLDTGVAVAGVIGGVFLRRHPRLRSALMGAAAGAVGVVGARYGAQLQATHPLFGASSSASSSGSGASTPSGASSTSASAASTGWGGSMSPRMLRPGNYGSRGNPFARNFAGVNR